LEIEAAHSSGLKTLLARSPKNMREAPEKRSPAMSLGTFMHALLLTPDTWQREFAVKPAGAVKNTKAGKSLTRQWLVDQLGDNTPELERARDNTEAQQFAQDIGLLEQALEDRHITVVSQEDLELAEAMRDAVMRTSLGSTIFSAGEAEVTMLAKDPATGVLIKTRPDWVPVGMGGKMVVDLKTTRDASPDTVARDSAKWGYHLQAALYQRVYRLVTGTTPAFLHCFVESAPPHDVGFFEMDEDALQAGEAKINRALDIFEKCKREGIYPGVGYNWKTEQYEIRPLSLPPWAL